VTETAPFVSVIVPHYNDFANLARCLGALRGQSWPSDRFEVIVADNNSEGGVAAVAAIAPWVRAVAAKEQGAGPARNAGAAVAQGEVLAFVDSDCVARRDWIAAGVAALENFDYVGGQVITATGELSRLTPSEAYEAVFAFDFKKYVEKDKYSGTGNLFVPKAIFARVGGFRAGVAEDMDWCWRANAMGYRLGYAEAAIVEHPARREWRELRRKHDRMEREMIRLASERRGWRSRWLGHAALVAGSPLFHSSRVVTSPRLPGMRAKLLGISGLVMIRFYRSYRMLVLLFRHDIRRGE
jgi:GT2 family glycosyltransferase